MAKSKVTKVIKFDKADQHGNIYFQVDFENGETGMYATKKADQTKFVFGKEADYLITPTPRADGTKYNRISLPPMESTPQQSGGFKGGGRPQESPQQKMISFAMSYTKDLIIGGKVEMEGLEDVFERIYSLMIKKL